MCSRQLSKSVLALIILTFIAKFGFCREIFDGDNQTSTQPLATDNLYPCTAQHTIGKIVFTVGEAGSGVPNVEIADCLTGQRPLPYFTEYPKGSGLVHGVVGFWVGSTYDGDTVVTASEVRRCRPIESRSTLDPSAPEFDNAISQQDYTIVYSDTFVDHTLVVPDYYDGLLSPDIPMHLLFRQRSHSWSYEYAEDIVLFDLTIKNIGDKTIENAYFGLTYQLGCGYIGIGYSAAWDDLVGLLRSYPVESACGLVDTLNLIWGTDNDGDPVYGEFIDYVAINESGESVKSCTGVTGVFFLERPPTTNLEPLRVSYNWWGTDWIETSYGFDFGPQRYSSYRDLRTGRWGYPSGDPNKYHFMRNREIDYDPIYTASIPPDDPVWMYPPPERAPDISDGFTFYQLLSVGPSTLEPGDEISLPFAFVAGENFHTDPHNIDNLPYNPDQYYANLDFTDLVKNAQWARWIYDNPGVDTDGDGDSGKTYVCPVDSTFNGSEWVITRADTIFYCGDGVPDWRAAAPPPAPVFWLTPLVNGLHVRFNGYRSETEVDVFSKIIDFEGYHIYVGRDERESSYSMVASYDRENYDKYVLDIYSDDYNYVCGSFPFTLDSLRCLYGTGCEDTVFHPLLYPPTNPFTHPDFPDSVFYFVPHDFNADDVSNRAPITKIYPDEPNPTIYHPDSIPDEAYTEDGYLKFYEYEFTIENLLPTVPYWVNVTAFDFGDARVHMRPLESGITAGAKSAYPMGAMEATAEGSGKVYVYPNPYRGDADYRDHGFEGRTEDDRPDNRVRAINFANLPPKCKICIYSLDGDLIRQLDHDIDPADPNHRHHVWNMITRNTQMIVTGIYYWVVEADDGSTQMGKLVVIF